MQSTTLVLSSLVLTPIEYIPDSLTSPQPIHLCKSSQIRPAQQHKVAPAAKIIASAPSPESFKPLRPRYKQRNEIALLKCRRSPSPLAVRSLSAPLASLSCHVLSVCLTSSRPYLASLSSLPFALLAAPVESGQRAASPDKPLAPSPDQLRVPDR